jgi:ATP-dependent DNA helicase RecQ
MDTARQHLSAVLADLAGPGAVPRDDQVEAVAAVLQPQARVLVVQATGWGKSAVYWAATSALRASGGGPTLVVSPLLALMRNQVDAARRAGLRAGTINSANFDDWDAVYDDLRNDAIDVVLISPERLGNPRFEAQLTDLLDRVGLVVIDEAHCISDWGFDFRPDYQRLARTLLATPNAAVLATTATANQRVTTDVSAQMGTDTVVFRGSLARTSLSLAVVPGLDPLDRFAWVAHALADLPGSGIVYTLTVAEAERLAGFLRSAGFECDAYTGQLDAADRERIEGALLRNELKAVVATSALGMGYDKPDLGFCVHVGSPSNPIAYYQQVGRAGRGLDHAVAVLLSSEADEKIWEYFATASIPRREDAEAVLALLAERSAGLADIEGETSIRRGRLDALLKILAVEGAVRRDGTKWAVTGEPYRHDDAKWTALEQVRATEADLMRAYAAGHGCLMEFLQRALDDPDPAPCGRCSVCTGTAPGPGVEPDARWRQAARDHVRGIEIEIEPRKRWPTGTIHSGAIRGLRPGRAVAFADDPGWADAVRTLVTSGTRIVPDELLDGAIDVLRRWSTTWGERPTWVMPAPASGAAADANRAVARHVATIGNRPLVEPWTWVGGDVPTDAPSRPIVEHLDTAISWDESVELPGGPVLVCSATTRTRWTAAVTARLLDERGRGPVLPLALHLRP